MNLRRGDVWLVDVPDYGVRPAVVLTRDAVLARLTSITVVPVTTRVRDIPTEVAMTPGRHGVTKPCVANCDNLLTVPRELFIRHLGTLDDETLTAIVEAIHVALALEW